MGAAVKTGKYVHVVATIDVKTGEGHIHYVNPVSKVMETDAKTNPSVEVVVRDKKGAELYRKNVVVRRSSPEPEQSNDVGLVQADIPRMAKMASVALLFKRKQVDEYIAGGAAPAGQAAGGMTLNLGGAAPAARNRRPLTIAELDGIAPVSGVTYTVQVKPPGQESWNTIAVGRPAPSIDIDRNQFPGVGRVDVRVMRTNGFDQEIIATDTLDL